MSRNRNMDIFRSIALLTVMVYHFWVTTGSFSFLSQHLTMLVSLGGEIGVTAFFALSGFGIFCSFRKQEAENQQCLIKAYIKKRAYRIMPPYYVSIFLTLLLINANSISREGIKDIVAHLFFIHNLFPQYHGSINGVLWTMGVIVQFYVIAPLLYKAFKKHGCLTEIVCILITCFLKCLTYRFFLPAAGLGAEYQFIYGRQLFTALDNFSIGMFAAWLLYERRICIHSKIKKNAFLILTLILGFIVCWGGQKYGIHTDNISGYIWHSCIAMIVGMYMLCVSQYSIDDKNIVARTLLWLSKYEYGIYIWHLLIFNNLIATSAVVQNMIDNSMQLLLFFPFLASAVFYGFLFTKMTDTISFSRRSKNKC